MTENAWQIAWQNQERDKQALQKMPSKRRSPRNGIGTNSGRKPAPALCFRHPGQRGGHSEPRVKWGSVRVRHMPGKREARASETGRQNEESRKKALRSREAKTGRRGSGTDPNPVANLQPLCAACISAKGADPADSRVKWGFLRVWHVPRTRLARATEIGWRVLQKSAGKM
jgi:hypothetical protein